MTVPRLELTAVVVSVKTSAQLQQEWGYEDVKEVFWTDSKVVLGNIANQEISHLRSKSGPINSRTFPS